MDISRQEIERIANSIPGAVAVYLIRNNLEMLYYTPELPDIMGFTPEEYAQRSDGDNFSLIVESDRPAIIKMAEQLTVSGDAECAYRVHMGGQDFRWMHIKARKIGVMDGFPVALVSYLNTSLETGIHEELLDRGNSIVYVSEIGTWDLLYVNQIGMDFWKRDHYLGRTCFSLFRGLDAPCPWCVVDRLHSDELIAVDTYDPQVGCHWHIESRNISWYGRKAFYVIATDVTEQVNSEVALKQSQQRYQLAVDGADLAVWEYDIKEHCIYSPEHSLSRFGMPGLVEGVPESIVDNVFEEDRDKFIDMYRRVDRGEPSASCDFGGYLAGDENTYWVRVTCTGVKDDEGQPSKAYCVLQDITAQHFLQMQYENSLHQMFTTSPSTLSAFSMNLSKNTCDSYYGTDAFAKALTQSASVDELVSKVAERIGDDAERALFHEKLDRDVALAKFAEGVTETECQYRRKMDSGEIHWISTHSNMMLNPMTQDVMAAITVVDIEEDVTKDQIMEQLTLKNFDYIAVIYPISNSIQVYFYNANFPSFLEEDKRGRMLDYDYICNGSVNSWVAEDSRATFLDCTRLPYLASRLDEDAHYSFEINVIGQSGDIEHHQLNYVYIGGGKDRILVTQQDVTRIYQQQEQRRIELAEQLKREQELKDEAERANKAKSAFLSSMSHDMRTPLNGILGFTGLALSADDAGMIRDYLNKIKVSGSLLLDLVNDTLTLSRAESGKLLVEEEPTIPSHLLEHIVVPVRETANLKGVEFVVDTSRMDDSPCMLDQLNMQKIVLNLLSNAVKFTPEGGTVRLSVETLKPPIEGMNTRIVVSDTGIGISEEFLPHIFEPFAQERLGGSGEASGTGLGLAIVHQLVNLSNGRISVESNQGGGSTFTMLFDIKLADEADGASLFEAQDEEGSDLSGKRVLLCEDNALNAEIAMTLLAHEGVDTVHASNGEEGFEMFASSEPGAFSAILMDLRMPVMDGYAATRAIRALDREDAKTIPIIAMSADAYKSDVEKSIDAGMDAHIAKPVEPKKLFETLASFCK